MLLKCFAISAMNRIEANILIMYRHDIRYLYVKNGDVIEQLRLINALQGKAPQGGPNAFLADFLEMIDDAPVLLLSAKSSKGPLVKKNIEARVFSKRFHGLGMIGRIAALVYMFFVSLFVALRFKPDRVICGTTGVLLWISWLVSKIRHTPFVHSRHNCMHRTGKNILKKLEHALDLGVIRRATAVICHGPYLHDQLLDSRITEAKIIEFDSGLENLVAQHDIHVSDKNFLRQNGAERIVLYVGRVEANKGVFDLLEAFRTQLAANPRLRLVYIGAGDAVPDLKATVSRLGLENRVIFAGRVDHAHIGFFLSQAYVLVTPTRRSFPEGRCMAAMDGLACGVPVIAPNFGPFPYLIKEGQNGLLFEPDSVADLAERLATLLDNAALHKKLSDGARRTGKALMVPALRFSEAVRRGLGDEKKRKQH